MISKEYPGSVSGIHRMSSGVAADRSILHCIQNGDWAKVARCPYFPEPVSAVISKNPFLGRAIILR